MIFQTFCENEFIDAAPFRMFIVSVYISYEQILNNPYALEFAWHEFLGFQYLKMLAEMESK